MFLAKNFAYRSYCFQDMLMQKFTSVITPSAPDRLAIYLVVLPKTTASFV